MNQGKTNDGQRPGLGGDGSGARPASTAATATGGHERDAAFVALVRAGDPSAFGMLFDLWADPVYDRISHRGFTTADVCELSTDTFATVYRRLDQHTSTDPFRVLVFRAASQQTIAAESHRVNLRLPVGPYAEDRLSRAADAPSLAADPAVATLLWQTADVLGDRVREVLDLHYRHGLTSPEIATVLNESVDTVDDILAKLPMGFGAVLRAQVLWRQGTPNHADLARALPDDGHFDTDTVRAIAEHQRDCSMCREESRLNVDPIDVFAAIPAVVAPIGFKEVVVERLAEFDIPITGSASYHAPEPEGAEVEDDSEDSAAGAAVGAAGLGAAGLAATAAVATAAVATDGVAAVAHASTSTGPTALISSDAGPAADIGSGSVAASRSTSGAATSPGAGASPSTHAAPTSASTGAASAKSPPSPPPSLVIDPLADEANTNGNRRMLIVGLAVIALVVVGVLVVLVKSSGGSKPSGLTSSGVSRPVITTTTAGASTDATPVPDAPAEAPAAESTTTLESSPTTIVVGVVPSNPTPTAAPTTTVPPFPVFSDATLTIANPNPSQPTWTMGPSGPSISWKITANQPVTVLVSGANFSSSSAQGSTNLCPGSVSGSTCTASKGLYPYKLVVTDQLGRTVFTKTVVLTVG